MCIDNSHYMMPQTNETDIWGLFRRSLVVRWAKVPKSQAEEVLITPPEPPRPLINSGAVAVANFSCYEAPHITRPDNTSSSFGPWVLPPHPV